MTVLERRAAQAGAYATASQRRRRTRIRKRGRDRVGLARAHTHSQILSPADVLRSMIEDEFISERIQQFFGRRRVFIEIFALYLAARSSSRAICSPSSSLVHRESTCTHRVYIIFGVKVTSAHLCASVFAKARKESGRKFGVLNERKSTHLSSCQQFFILIAWNASQSFLTFVIHT